MSNSESISSANSSDSDPEGNNKVLAKHHVSKILDEVLDQSAEEATEVAPGGTASKVPSHKHPIIIDAVLACGLIVAVGGFTVGLLNMYVDHLAEQSLKRSDYAAAVALLDGIPMPQYLIGASSESKELFDRALYLDATQKLSANPNDQFALNELNRIMPGSQFFDSSQDVLTEHFKPATVTLTGGTSKEEEISQAELAKMKAEQQTAQALNQY
jgi:hypothetical protein